MSRSRIWMVTGAAFVVVLLLDLVVQYARFPGYGALLGFGGCYLLVYVAKFLGQNVLQRRETYYADDVIPDDQRDVRPDVSPQVGGRGGVGGGATGEGGRPAAGERRPGSGEGGGARG
ncbi:hypothetical protein [Egicoccus halophilus]|uniref:Uncharacterized protein n=1 Tax=Egicoccus halophilus TaxID=1670830 RepID=A0A8J3A769_9ACTN|nr:hypothetical protein [Egicoccus halophilus]GGI05248.1 hypothetical protein GCM10011354_13150 [Egicoccus halophilus]